MVWAGIRKRLKRVNNIGRKIVWMKSAVSLKRRRMYVCMLWQ